MAFPIIETTQISIVGSDTTSHGLSMPAGIQPGDIIIVFFTCDDSGVGISINSGASSAGWNIVQGDFSISNTACWLYRIAYPSSTALTLTTDVSTQSTSIAYRVSGASKSVVPHGDLATGNSANFDPPSVTPAKGAQDYLWLVYGGTDSTVVASVAPTDFTGLLTQAGGVDGASSSSAYRAYNIGTVYNPGVFTSTIEQWVTFTVLIYPGSLDGFSLGNISYDETSF